MARTLTRDVALQYAVESSLGTLPGSPQWRTVEPNDISTYGPSVETVERRPISPDRARRPTTVVDKISDVEFTSDLTMDAMTDFVEGFVYSEFANVGFDLKSSNGPPPAVDGGGSADSFTIDAASSLLAGKVTGGTAGSAAQTLVYAKGYTNSGNNGIWPLTNDLAGSGTALEVLTASLTAEASPPSKASLQVCGVRVSDNDLTFTKSGSTATLVSASDISDWSALGLRAGQYIHIGGVNTSTGSVTNALNASATDDTYGYARITSISSGTLNLDKLDTNLGATADNNGEGAGDVLFGRFVRNVATTADSDDNRFLERSYQFEATFADLGGVGTDEYEYAIGNRPNEITLNVGLNDKATVDFGFIGTNADAITTSRKTNAASAVDPLRIEAVNTASDIASLTTDLIGSASDVCFKSLSLTLANGASRENCLGTLGASFINTDLFEVNLEAEALFTDDAITNAIVNNTTTTFAMVLRNADGAIAVDIPSLKFGDGGRSFPTGASVTVNLAGVAFNDPAGTIPDVSLGISLFPVVPTA